MHAMLEYRFVRTAVTLIVTFAAILLVSERPALAAPASQLDRDVDAALHTLYDGSPTAKVLGGKAKGILVFPKLIKNGRKVGYYNASAVSVGLQAGAQSFGFAIFFMTDAAMQSFEKSNGFEIGVGPTVVIVDAGAARDINTLTAKSDVYAFVFGQKGLMAGIGLQGTKITKLKR
jgi:lipid-binding SYLF domain-containing protein